MTYKAVAARLPQTIPSFFVRKTLFLLAALAALAACRETNPSQQSRPSAADGSAPARTLRFDTTFLTSLPARTYRHSFTTTVPLGRSGKASLPVDIEWLTTQTQGCAQVAAVRVYQLGRVDADASLSACARRDAHCRPGRPPVGSALRPDGRQPAYTGLVLLQLTGVSHPARTFASVSLTLNGLGYHDAPTSPSPTPKLTGGR